MNITQQVGAGRYIIRGYDQRCVIINDRSYQRSLIVTPDRLAAAWEPQTLAELTPAHLEAVARMHPEVVLLGTGTCLCFPGPSIVHFFLQRGIGLETMDTAAACRTFNVLVAERRAVAAALLID